MVTAARKRKKAGSRGMVMSDWMLAASAISDMDFAFDGSRDQAKPVRCTQPKPKVHQRRQRSRKIALKTPVRRMRNKVGERSLPGIALEIRELLLPVRSGASGI